MVDSEATVILRQPAASSSGPHRMTAATMPSRTSRSESTAVFVGRASFQMIPARHAGRQARAEARAELTELAGVLATPAPSVILVENAMTPPPVTEPQAVPAIFQATPSGTVLRLFSPGEVTEPIQAHVRSARPRGPVTARALRTVVVALLAGATITLSAEAVMRRPTPVDVSKVEGPSARPQLVGGAEGALAIAPAQTLPAEPAPTVPTVVASTATVAPAEPAEPAVRPTPAQHKRQRPRATPSHAGGPSAIATAQGARTTAITMWVDPFAPPAEPVASKTGPTTWVDPFAN